MFLEFIYLQNILKHEYLQRVERRFGLRPFVSTTFADYSLEGTLQFLRIDRQHVDRIYFPDIRYCD